MATAVGSILVIVQNEQSSEHRKEILTYTDYQINRTMEQKIKLFIEQSSTEARVAAAPLSIR